MVTKLTRCFIGGAPSSESWWAWWSGVPRSDEMFYRNLTGEHMPGHGASRVPARRVPYSAKKVRARHADFHQGTASMRLAINLTFNAVFHNLQKCSASCFNP
jgi:hypothetical protein